MTSGKVVDWRDIAERLTDPKQRRAIVTKTNTDELNRMKTKNVFLKRKLEILDRIKRTKNNNNNNNKAQNADGKDGRDASPDSRCSELNFSNVDTPSTPPPTLPTTTTFPRPGVGKAGAGVGGVIDPHAPEYENIDMGDYEHRIRASSAFWRKPDGLTLAEKIIYYRNWKYKNRPKDLGIRHEQPAEEEMETTLTNIRRTKSPSRQSKSADAAGRKEPTGDEKSRPVTVIPKMATPVTLPPVENRRRAVVVTSAHGMTPEKEKLPAIDQTPLVSRSPVVEKVRKTKVVEINEIHEYHTITRRAPLITETAIDSVIHKNHVDVKDIGEKEEDVKEDKKDEEDVQEEEEAVEVEVDETPDDEPRHSPAEDKPESPPADEPNEDEETNEDQPEESIDPSEPEDALSSKKRRKKKLSFPILPKAPRPQTEPDKLIKKLDKRAERDLRALQGIEEDQPNDDDGDDDDDEDLDDSAIDDILHGERGKELDRFLKS